VFGPTAFCSAAAPCCAPALCQSGTCCLPAGHACNGRDSFCCSRACGTDNLCS
jgi:hypothetical protein